MNAAHDTLAVILCTYNRAEVLRETLEHICRVNRESIDVRLYVVDNNSTDHTAAVIDAFTERLPLVHLFEPCQGKNSAVNRGIAALDDESVVLFTDDDVIPCEGWFREVLGACERWPGHDVFGGRILIRWPPGRIVPSWAHLPEVLLFGFAQNDLGDHDTIYPPESFPFGPNFWVRRSIFDTGRTFGGSIGPNPDDYKMGQDIVFLRALTQEGHEIVHCPSACVHHRVEARLLSPWQMCRRAWARGKGKVYMAGIPHRAMLATNRPKWYMLRAVSLFWAGLRLLKAMVTLNGDARFRRIISAITQAGIQVEAVRVVRDKSPQMEHR